MRFFPTMAFVARALLFAVASYYATWASAADENESFHRFWPDNLFAVDFVSEQTGYIAGQGGTVLRTTDGGENWDALYIGKNELIRRLDFVSEKEGWAIGHRGSIFHTANAGEDWEVQFEVPGTYLRDVAFADKKHGWVVGHGATILHTADGGISWQKQEMRGFNGRDLPRFHGVYARDQNTAVVVGEFGTVVHTENGGELWLLTPSDIGVTWLAVSGQGGLIYTVGADGTAAYLALATDAQRKEIDRETAEVAVKKELKARKKAKRRKKEFVAKMVEALPRADIEYIVNPIDTGTEEHLFDLTALSDGSALVVGRSTVLKVSVNGAEPLSPAIDVPLGFVWMGGVSVAPSGTFWAVGIRGMVVKGDTTTLQFATAFNLASSDNITLISNQWTERNGQ